MSDQRVSAVAPQKTKPSDNVISEAERLNARLSSIYSVLHDLRARVSGTVPEGTADGAGSETAFSMGGFVGTAGQALEQAHRTANSILGVIEDIERVI